LFTVLSVRHYLGDQDRLPFEINHPDQPEFVSADIKDGLTINQIRAAKRPFQFGQILPRRRSNGLFPVRQGFSSVCVAAGELIQLASADDSHLSLCSHSWERASNVDPRPLSIRVGHTGGGVMGVPGYNAAREILKDQRGW
jgi:hypothetical protein